MSQIFEARRGAAVLLDVRSRRIIAAQADDVARSFLAPPGSTLKPFVLDALLRTRRLSPSEAFVCAGTTCAHPRLDLPLHVDTALAYSCNDFVGRVAERFTPAELARELARAGLDRASAVASVRLLALGEQGVLTTVAELAMAYRRLALEAAPIVLEGLEQAVAYGTAQRAAIRGVKVAGKTGSVMARSGAHVAWFAGFAPSRSPEVVVTVMLQARSGGAHAAPMAAEVLSAYRAGRL